MLSQNKKKLEIKQLKIIKYLKNYFLKNNSPFLKKNFFAFYDENEGIKKLKKNFLKEKNFNFKNLLIRVYSFLFHNYFFIIKSKMENKKFKNLIITWGSNNLFSKKGFFNDKYFSMNSKYDKLTFWIVIVENEIPKKFSKNIAIVYKRKNFFLNLNNIIIIFLNFFKSFSNKISIDQDGKISNEIINFVKKNHQFSKIKNLIMPYEGQAFQKRIFHTFQKKTKTYGFDHSAPHSIPTHLIHTKGSPKNLLVSGLAAKYTYSKYLNWNKKDILITHPSRFEKFKKKDFSNTMFLPYNFDKEFIILKSLQNFISRNTEFSIDKIKIKIHPIKLKVRSHENLKKNIINLIKKNNIEKIRRGKKDLTIVVGFTTTPLVALEYGNTVLHICPNPTIDAYLSCLWKDLDIEQIDDYSFIYKLKSKGKYLDFTKKNIIKKILKYEIN